MLQKRRPVVSMSDSRRYYPKSYQDRDETPIKFSRQFNTFLEENIHNSKISYNHLFSENQPDE